LPGVERYGLIERQFQKCVTILGQLVQPKAVRQRVTVYEEITLVVVATIIRRRRNAMGG
jgi:hypothetical protein